MASTTLWFVLQRTVVHCDQLDGRRPRAHVDMTIITDNGKTPIALLVLWAVLILQSTENTVDVLLESA